MSKFRIQIADESNREYVFAEIWYEDQLIAEIIQETGQAEIVLYTEVSTIFNYHDFVRAVESAKKHLFCE